jgi:hypothetical protein
MKNCLKIVAFVLVGFLLASCAETPLELSVVESCTPDPNNEFMRRTITTEGYLTLATTIFCSGDRNGNLRCGLTLLQEPGEIDYEVRNLNVDFIQGTGNNQIEEVQRGFTLESIIIRDADGNRIDLTQPVQVTGSVLTGTESCSMDVDVIRQVGSE